MPWHENLPSELKAPRQWIVWRYGLDEVGKITKHPYTPHAIKRKAKSNDPKTWNTFDKALAAADGFNGLGFVLTATDPWTVIDLDHCRNKVTGAIEPWAWEIILSLNSYTEISPSGEGVHIWTRGKVVDTKRKKGNVEIFFAGFYLTMTGNHLEGTPTTIEDRQAEIEVLHREIFAEGKKETPRSAGPSPSLDLSDLELIDRALIKDGKFQRLWHGDISDYDSHSEADLALCCKLAFRTGKDAARIDRLFRESGLCQESGRKKKWDRRTGDSTYGAMTIEKAIAQITEVYTPGVGVDPRGGTRTGQKKDACKESQDTGKGKEPKKRPTIIEITGAELSTKVFPEPRWAVPKLIPEGYGVLGGRPKIGKSWLALEFALAVAKGGYALGSEHYSVNMGSVRYLALEDTQRRIKERQHLLLCGDCGPENLFIVTKHPKIDEGGLETLDTWLAEYPECRLVIIDTLAKVKPKNKRTKDAYDHDMDYGGQLQDLANTHRVCLLAIHHTRKNKSDTDDFIDELAGSTGITGAPDFIMVLSRGRNEETGVLQITGRDIEEIELAMKFSPGQGTWTLLGQAREYNMSQQRLAVLDVLRNTNEALTPKDIAEMTKISHGSVKHLVSELYQAGLVSRVGYGKYKNK